MTDAKGLQPTAPCTARLITTVHDLDDLAHRILRGDRVAVDTESNSLYSYSEKVCLVQLSLPDADYIVDPLSTYSLEPLAEVFASPRLEKVFHGADYDLVSLKRGYGFHVVNIFDTMVAARILGRKNIGLADLVAESLGLRMDKSMQRSDWGRRPLSGEQLAYACHDTRYLMGLRDELLAKLQRAGREDEAREAFAELATIEPRPRIFDADGFWHMKGVRDLDSAGQRIVRALYRWREEQARWEDRPVFKVLGDRALVALGERGPTTLEALRHSRLLSPYQTARYGQQMVDILNKARRSQEHLRPPSVHRPLFPDAVTLSLYDRLRTWRKERAAQRGVDPDVVISNDALMALATRRPQTPDELEGIAGLGSWRRRQYGQEIMDVIRDVLQHMTGHT